MPYHRYGLIDPEYVTGQQLAQNFEVGCGLGMAKLPRNMDGSEDMMEQYDITIRFPVLSFPLSP